MRRIPLEHVYNLRDLGGYPTQDGRYTQYGRFFRSDAPVRLSDQELARLSSLDIRTVIDLRSVQEAEAAPCALASLPAVKYHHINLNGFSKMPGSAEDMPHSYLTMTENTDAVRQIMQVIAHAPTGVLFHCTAGKDRTGVTAALLLSLAGVPLADILADYQVSFTYIEPLLLRMKKDNPALPYYLAESRWTYLEGFFTLFNRRYGSAEQYIQGIGLSGEEIALLRAKLLD